MAACDRDLPAVSDAELVIPAVMQALLGFTSEARWLRYARKHLAGLFPRLPGQSGYNKRLRKLAVTQGWLIRVLATETSLWQDDVWVIDSTPVECGRSRDTVLRPDLAGWAEYGLGHLAGTSSTGGGTGSCSSQSRGITGAPALTRTWVTAGHR